MKIAFVSTHNAVRSIIAESVARKLSRLALLTPEVYSAGVEPAEQLDPAVIELLKKKGYPTDRLYPKDTKAIPYDETDILITLSPEARDNCPYSEKHLRREHWVVEEAKTLNVEELTKLLEHLENLIKGLFKIS